MHLPFSKEKGCTFPEHLLDPEIGKTRAHGSFQMLPRPLQKFPLLLFGISTFLPDQELPVTSGKRKLRVDSAQILLPNLSSW